MIYLPTFPGLPYKEIPIGSPPQLKYKLVLGFGAGKNTTSKKSGRLTGIGFGIQGETLAMQIWRMDIHPTHGMRSDKGYTINDPPFHYQINRAPQS